MITFYSILNMNSEDKSIWATLEKLAMERNINLIHMDDEYKQQLIKGHKICTGKMYTFKSIKEEEDYFMRSDITPEEEVYYYEFIVKWSDS